MQYADWINAVAAMLEYSANVTDAAAAPDTDETPTNNEDFNNLIPRAIDYTENRLQRDLDLLATIVTTPTGLMVPNQRLQTLPSINDLSVGEVPNLVGTPIAPNSTLTTTLGSNVVTVNWPNNGLSQGQNVSIPTPVSVGGLTMGGVYNVVTVLNANQFTILAPTNATSAATAVIVGNGIFVVCRQIRPIIGGVKQKPLEFVSRDFLDFAWPSDVSPGSNIPPVQWSTNDQATVLMGPAPDQAYGFEAMGTMRIQQLSAANYQNFLTLQFPDLYLQCSLVFWFNFQQRDESKQNAADAENQYQMLLKSSVVEEIRKQFANQFPSPSYPTGVKAA